MEKLKNSLEIKKNYVFACAISFVFFKRKNYFLLLKLNRTKYKSALRD